MEFWVSINEKYSDAVCIHKDGMDPDTSPKTIFHYLT